MTDKELVKRLLDFDKVTVGDARAAALRIEALLNLNEALVELMDDHDANLAKAVELLRAVEKHDVSVFWGVDAEKNRRASWRGVMRKVKATLAEIEGTNAP